MSNQLAVIVTLHELDIGARRSRTRWSAFRRSGVSGPHVPGAGLCSRENIKALCTA